MNKITLPVLTVFGIFLAGCWPVGIRGNGHITTDSRTIRRILGNPSRRRKEAVAVHKRWFRSMS